jgi:endonuclease I
LLSWSNQIANSARANLPIGIVKGKSSNGVCDNGMIVGYKNEDYFMLTDECKGGIGRILLYMYSTYKDD